MSHNIFQSSVSQNTDPWEVHWTEVANSPYFSPFFLFAAHPLHLLLPSLTLSVFLLCQPKSGDNLPGVYFSVLVVWTGDHQVSILWKCCLLSPFQWSIFLLFCEDILYKHKKHRIEHSWLGTVLPFSTVLWFY